jgi:hypothetical protein
MGRLNEFQARDRDWAECTTAVTRGEFNNVNEGEQVRPLQNASRRLPDVRGISICFGEDFKSRSVLQ